MRGVRPGTGAGGVHVAHVHREHPTLRAHDRGVREHPQQRVGFQRRRHDEQPQRLAKVPLRFDAEREAEVAVQVPLVEFVEDHQRDAFERRVVLQHPREDALGHDLDARARPDAGLEPCAEPDRLADILPEQRGHALGDRARRDAARLQHQDPLVSDPGGVEERERHHSALAGAGRRLEHDAAMRGQRGPESGQRLDDRQRRQCPHPAQCSAATTRDAGGGAMQDAPGAVGAAQGRGKMTGSIGPWLLAAFLILLGVLGSVLPGLPGIPLVFAGLVAAAWADDFQRVGWIALTLLGLMTLVSFAIDFLATTLGAKRVGATRLAVAGALVGTLVGIFLGLPGLILGPFLGAVAGELVSHGKLQQAGRAGLATWVGLLFGTLAKIALVFTMLGVFAAAYFF